MTIKSTMALFGLSSKLLQRAKIKISMLCGGQGQTYKKWEPIAFEKFQTFEQSILKYKNPNHSAHGSKNWRSSFVLMDYLKDNPPAF